MDKLYGISAGGISEEDAERAWFAGLLWKAFPEARSEEDLCKIAARALTRKGRPVHPRTVKNWARQLHTPHFRYVLRVYALAKFEGAMTFLDLEGETP